ncbi:MAG: GNAT family N-acetyltransferase [Nanobdellota archaeon]
MLIRKATPDDATDIYNIAETLRQDPEKLKSNGLLPDMLTEEEYAQRALLSEYFYVAVDKGKIIGFLMCYDNSTVNYLMRECNMEVQDEFVIHLSKISEPYIFGDQVGILPEYPGLEIGQMLISAAVQDLLKNHIYRFEGCIQHNHNSEIPLFAIKQFNLKNTTQIKQDGKLWDIYTGRLPS